MGTPEWAAVHGNLACECTDGVCAKCCRETCNPNGTHTCAWQEPKSCVTAEVPADDACSAGFSRAYAGANCAGGAGSAWEAEHGNTGCDCTDGFCQNCCREEAISDDGAYNCTWAAPKTCFHPEASFVPDDGCAEG